MARRALSLAFTTLTAAACGPAPSSPHPGQPNPGQLHPGQPNAGSLDPRTSSDGPACGHQGDPEPPQLAGITAAHNAIRCQLRRPSGEALAPLSWSRVLAAEAQRYADQLAANGCDLQHSQTEYGENLLAGSSKHSPAEVVARWASEQDCFHRDAFPACCSCTCGHYTQLVWADSRRLGCGTASCSNGYEVWVCNYDPAGNYTGSAPY